MRDMYGADERSQKLKYHIQTSGRSLPRRKSTSTTSEPPCRPFWRFKTRQLLTNAYDEAITTPTEESPVPLPGDSAHRQQGERLDKTENPMQGAYIVDELTDLVEEAVLQEFEAISRRGGVLEAMETMYQREIQDESMYYEHLKHDGTLPIIGVNTFQNPNAAAFDESAADDFEMGSLVRRPRRRKPV